MSLPSTITPRDSVLQPGDTAPDFELPTQNRGETWRLSEALKKGDVALSFFPFAFTGVCSTEMECITKEWSKLTGKGGTVVGISCDSGPALKAWADQLGLQHTLMSDLHRVVCRGYGLFWPDLNVAWRGTVLVGQNGKVKWSQKRDIPAAFSLDEMLSVMA